MSMEAKIKLKLMEALTPKYLQILNESDQHAHHAGSPGTGDSHFRVHIISDCFVDKSRVDRHRMVNEALVEEMKTIHALAIKAQTSDEASG